MLVMLRLVFGVGPTKLVDAHLMVMLGEWAPQNQLMHMMLVLRARAPQPADAHDMRADAMLMMLGSGLGM